MEKNPIKWLTSKEAEEGYIPNRELLSYALGFCGTTANGNFISSYFFYFCTDVLHITPVVVGIITSISKVWDGINDPLAGTFIDGRRCKSGDKFHGYLTKLPIFIGILTTIMFINFGLSTAGTVIVVLITYLMWDFLYSFQEVSIWGTVSLMSPHSAERARATQWTLIGSNGGYALVALVPFVMGMRESLGISEKTEFMFFGLLYGLGCGALATLTGKGRERVAHERSEHHSLLEHLSAVKENRILLLLISAQLLASITPTVPQIYFFKNMVSYKVGGKVIAGETVMFFFNTIVSTPGTLGMFFANKIAKKLGGMQRVLIIGEFMQLILGVIAFLVGYQTIPQMIIVLLLLTAAFVPSEMVGIAIRSLVCDSVDYTEWKTGRRTEAISFALESLTVKVAGAISSLICGGVLEWLKYDETLAVQSDAFYKFIWPLYILGPYLGIILFLIPALRIRYSQKDKQRVEDELMERRASRAQSQEAQDAQAEAPSGM